MARYDHVDSPLDSITPTYERLQARLTSRVTYDLDYRTYNLKQLAFLINDNREAIAEALKRDLDKGPASVDLEELWPITNEIEYAVRKLPTWMKDEGRIGEAILSFKLMRPKIKKQPKGVALIIGPWNYPWQCNLIPLVCAIAAGCPAVVKPSELAPSSSALLAELLPRYLDPEAYAVVLGGQKHAEALMEKQWGHVIFTGSGRVGKLIAAAAAKTLSPTTLELGGKSPVIIAPDADLSTVVKRLLSVKQMGAGQMCVCPDYVLCVEERLDELLSTIKATLDSWYPPHPHPESLLSTPSSAKLFSPSGFERQRAFVDKAEAKGLVYYRGEMNKETRRMGITVVKMPKGGKGDDTGLLEEELFGPILPVVPVKNLEEAVQYISARPHPLALYLCCKSSKVQQYVEKHTISGSMTTNDFALATINRSIPFGGVGDSGWGAYHGEDGFNTFTHRKAVLDVPLALEPVMFARYPPLTNLKRFMMRQMFVVPLGFSRPVSVEAERAARKRTKVVKLLALALVILTAGYFGPSLGVRFGGWY